jgi:hypothetical protein
MEVDVGGGFGGVRRRRLRRDRRPRPRLTFSFSLAVEGDACAQERTWDCEYWNSWMSPSSSLSSGRKENGGSRGQGGR